MFNSMRGKHPVSILCMILMPAILLVSAVSTMRLSVVVAEVRALPMSEDMTREFDGQIAVVGDDQIKIVEANGEDHTFPVPTNATVTIDGAESSLAMLAPGLYATISAKSASGQWIASVIHANRTY